MLYMTKVETALETDQADQDKSQHEQVMGAVSLLAAATIGRAPSEMPNNSNPTTPKATRRRSTEQELVQELRTAFELYTKVGRPSATFIIRF